MLLGEVPFALVSPSAALVFVGAFWAWQSPASPVRAAGHAAVAGSAATREALGAGAEVFRALIMHTWISRAESAITTTPVGPVVVGVVAGCFGVFAASLDVTALHLPVVKRCFLGSVLAVAARAPLGVHRHALLAVLLVVSRLAPVVEHAIEDAFARASRLIAGDAREQRLPLPREEDEDDATRDARALTAASRSRRPSTAEASRSPSPSSKKRS